MTPQHKRKSSASAPAADTAAATVLSSDTRSSKSSSHSSTGGKASHGSESGSGRPHQDGNRRHRHSSGSGESGTPTKSNGTLWPFPADSAKNRVEMARNIRAQTRSINFKIRLGFSALGFAICIYFLFAAVTESSGRKFISFLRSIDYIPTPIVIISDLLYCVSFALLGVYILTNRRGHYTFWAFYSSVVISTISLVIWCIVLLCGIGREQHIAWHLFLIPLAAEALCAVFFLVDKELRRAICGEYEFRQIIREQGIAASHNSE